MNHIHPHDAGQGAVVVDIGGDVGALVLYTEAEMAGAEIEISPVDDDARRRHVAVHARHVPGHRTLHAAVYPALVQGSYRLWRPDGHPAGVVQITGGKITERRWADIGVP
jgi:hypothetical protein